MKTFTILPLVALCSSALCAPSPENELEVRSAANECTAITIIISILSQYKASATSFCSSFISIPVKTVTSTNIVTSTSIASTVIRTSMITPEISITATTTVTPTVAPILNPPVPEVLPRDDSNIQKRSAPPIPNYLIVFPSSKISSACSYLSIVPSTTIVKATSTVIVPSIITARTTVTEPPVTTTVADVTVTASTTLTECAQAGPTVVVKLTTSIIINGTQLLNTYGLTRRDYEDEGIRIDRLSFNGYTAPTSDGVLFPNFQGVPGFLVAFGSGFQAVRLGNETGVQALHFEDPRLFDNIDTPDLCVVDDGGLLTCTRPDGATIWQLCPETNGFNDLFIGPRVGSGCSEVGVEAVPVCTPAPAS